MVRPNGLLTIIGRAERYLLMMERQDLHLDMFIGVMRFINIRSEEIYPLTKEEKRAMKHFALRMVTDGYVHNICKATRLWTSRNNIYDSEDLFLKLLYIRKRIPVDVLHEFMREELYFWEAKTDPRPYRYKKKPGISTRKGYRNSLKKF